MRHRSFFLLASLLMLLIFGSVAVYAVDAAHEDDIAAGVTVARIDVGGMDRAEAREALAQQIHKPVQKTVHIRFGRTSFQLPPEQARARADIDAMVDDAIAASRKGNIVSRVGRTISGAEVHEDVPASVVYDEDAVDRLVERVEQRIERPPTDATLHFAGGALKKVRGKPGITLHTDALRDAVGDELAHPTPDRVVEVRVTKKPPKVGIRDLKDKYPTVVTIDRDHFRLRVYKKLKLAKKYPIAVGQAGLETPAGRYRVETKAVNPAWHVPKSSWAGGLAGRVIPPGSPDNPIKSRWLGIHDGDGIHGTDDLASLGEAASHGCIRMSIPDVKEVYRKVPVNAPVFVA
jgi:lipoprotein-anchoring transpeptidase ErfK/SrfK